jgi:hypothetical protein
MATNQTTPRPGVPLPPRALRIEVPPEHEGKSCIFITAHVSRRLEQRFGLNGLKEPPFEVYTHYCEATDIDRPTWAIRVGNGVQNGYMLGRWELADPGMSRGQYKYWFVATTAIYDHQFKNSRLNIRNSVKIKVVRIVDELVNPPWERTKEKRYTY